ncbi:MAG: monovalent cation/H+ antiporter complex subunit F [Verrucomicrobiales bacterium]|nr:monovalent cation/H+ antiporter complex subunit F [Verrucomicrobiales bacterium]
MFFAAMVAIIVVMGLTLVRAILGPTEYDRILAVNKFGTMTTFFICVIGFLTERPDFVDIALVYVLVNFVGTIAVLRYYEYGTPDQETLER